MKPFYPNLLLVIVFNHSNSNLTQDRPPNVERREDNRRVDYSARSWVESGLVISSPALEVVWVKTKSTDSLGSQ